MLADGGALTHLQLAQDDTRVLIVDSTLSLEEC